jgi:hypothetical protein
MSKIVRAVSPEVTEPQPGTRFRGPAASFRQRIA